MRILRSPQALHNVLAVRVRRNKRVGFVPTMGYLHEGHLSLVRRSVRENDVTVASIFVNPLQFGPAEDLSRYPRSFRRDAALLKRAGADLLFAPGAKALYPDGFQTTVTVGELTKGLCGRTRPTHFAGVATVVSKLLNIVGPCRVYLGQKDYQQFKVIERLIADLDIPARAVLCPIVREKDGLAMSSRNVFLSPTERREALVLSRALSEGARAIRAGARSARAVRKVMLETLKKAGTGRPDYAEIVDARTLRPMVKLQSGMEVLLATAVCFPKARLIDNRTLKVTT